MDLKHSSQETFGRHLASLGRHPSTSQARNRDINRFYSYLEEESGIPAAEICLRDLVPLSLGEGGPVVAYGSVDAQTVENFMAHITEGISNPYKRAKRWNRALQSLKMYIQHQKRRGELPHDPTKLVVRARIPRRVPPRKYLTREEFVRLATVARTHGPDRERNYALIMTYGCSGVRPGEGRTLTPAGLVFEQDRLEVCGKTGRRKVPMVAVLKAILKHYIASPYYQAISQGRSDFPLFPWDSEGNPFSGDQLCDLIKDLAAAADIRIRVTPYTLRHTFATLAYEDGARWSLIMRALGHKRCQNTFTYVGSLRRRLRELARDNAAVGPLERAYAELKKMTLKHQLHFDFSKCR